MASLIRRPRHCRSHGSFLRFKVYHRVCIILADASASRSRVTAVLCVSCIFLYFSLSRSFRFSSSFYPPSALAYRILFTFFVVINEYPSLSVILFAWNSVSIMPGERKERYGMGSRANAGYLANSQQNVNATSRKSIELILESGSVNLHFPSSQNE